VITALKDKDIRGFMDDRDEKIGRKIRDAEVKKVPYMLIVGEKEVLENKVAVRKHGLGDQGSMGLEEFENYFVKECALPV
jgi:threonyl-tRNA synthetase